MSRRAAPRRRGIRSSAWFRTTRSSISRRIARSRGPAGSATTAAPGSWPTLGPLLAHSCLAVRPSGATLGLAHQTIWARPPKGVTPQTRASAVWADTVETIGRPPDGPVFVSVGDRGADIFAPLERVREAGWDAVVRAVRDRRLVQGGGSRTALRAARPLGASRAPRASGPRLARRWFV